MLKIPVNDNWNEIYCWLTSLDTDQSSEVTTKQKSQKKRNVFLLILEYPTLFHIWLCNILYTINYFGNPKMSVIDQSYFTAQSPPIMAKDKTSPCRSSVVWIGSIWKNRHNLTTTGDEQHWQGLTLKQWPKFVTRTLKKLFFWNETTLTNIINFSNIRYTNPTFTWTIPHKSNLMLHKNIPIPNCVSPLWVRVWIHISKFYVMGSKSFRNYKCFQCTVVDRRLITVIELSTVLNRLDPSN